MSKWNNKSIIDVHYNNLSIFQIYRGLRLVWELVKSCFGSGFWINSAPWLDKEAWKNNN